MPAPGTMVGLSQTMQPAMLTGVKVYANEPFRFDFILDKGDSQSNNLQLKDESTKLIKYFLTSLTIPEKDLWVNLSPYEKDRIVPETFGVTEMGRDLLAEDYMLKQVTASLIYPEDEVGKKFWNRVYEEASKKYGTTNIPVNTFNKVWIVPGDAVVYENEGSGYIQSSRLKVMLEEDYVALSKNSDSTKSPKVPTLEQNTHTLGSQIIREIVLPELEKEINEDKNFAPLRQIYNSLILAVWYKEKLRSSILNQVYSDQNKIVGVNIKDKQEKEKIYQKYLEAFKKGVYNYIKEETDPITGVVIPRKYFSGGFGFTQTLPKLHRSSYPQGFQPKQQYLFIKSVFTSYLDSDKAMAVFNKVDDIKVLSDKPLIYGPLVTNAENRRTSMDPTARNAVYINVTMQEGRMIKGDYLESFPSSLRSWVFKKYGEFVVKNISLDKSSGEFQLGGIVWWHRNMDYKGADQLTAHFKEGELLAVYDKDGKQIYKASIKDKPNTVYLGTKINNGLIVSGKKVEESLSNNNLEELITIQESLAISNVSLNGETLTIAGKTYWTSMPSHKKVEGLTAHFIKGELIAVYDQRGIQLYTSQKESEGQGVFINSIIKNGKRVGGNLVQVIENESNRDLLYSYPDFIATNIALGNNGELTFAGIHWWGNQKYLTPGSLLTVHFKNGLIYRAYDANGRLIYREAQEGDANSVYIGAKLDENGKKVGGEFLKAYPSKLPQVELIKRDGEYVITGVRLNNKGEYRWKTNDEDYIWFSSSKDAMSEDVMVYFKDHKVVSAYHKDGTLIWLKPKEGDRNSLYVNGQIIDGKRVGGEFVDSYPNFKAELFDKYDDFILTNVKLQHDGSLRLTNERIFWNRLIGYEYAEGITLFFKEKELQAAYDKDGKQIFSNQDTGVRNALYVEATVDEDGKRVGGKYIKSYPNVFPSELFDKYKDFVIENVDLNAAGGSALGNKIVVPQRRRYIGKKDLRVYVKDGEVAAVYEKDGSFLYAPTQEGDANSLYTNAEIKGGKRIGGEFLDAYPLRAPKSILDLLPDFILTNVELNKVGNFSFGGETFFIRLEHKNKKNVTVRIKDKKLIEAYDENGEKIFGELVEGDRNTVYINARLDDHGRRIGGEFHRAFGDYVPDNYFSSFNDVVVANVHLQAAGGLAIGGKVYWTHLASYEGVKEVSLYFKKGELISAYDKDGVRIYTNDLSDKKNVFYINGTIEKGKRKGGEFAGIYGHIQAASIQEYKDLIIENIDIDNQTGRLMIGNVTYWNDRPELMGAKGLMAHFQNGILIAVYDKQGQQIYDGTINKVYLGGHLQNGRCVGGTWVMSVPIYIPRSLLEDNEEVIVRDIQLDDQGAFWFNQYWWRRLETHKNAKGVTAYFKAGVLVMAYDQDGNVLYARTSKGVIKTKEELKVNREYIPAVVYVEGDDNSLYVGAIVENGKRKGGTFKGAYPRMPQEVIQENSDAIIEYGHTDSGGAIKLANGLLYLNLGILFADQTDLTIVYRNREITEVYDTEGQQIYPKQAQSNERNSVYVEGVIINGKREGGRFINAYASNFPSRIIDQYPTGIIENVHSSLSGSIGLGTGKLTIGLGTANGGKKGLTVVYQDKKIIFVYDKEGRQLNVETKEGDPDSVYINAEVQNGRFKSGEFIAAPKYFNKEFFDKYPTGVIFNVRVPAGANVKFGNGALEAALAHEHERKEGYLVVYKHKAITEVYAPDGLLVYKDGKAIKKSYVFESNDPSDKNAVYINGQMDHGKRVGGQFLGAFPKRGVAKAFFDEHKEGIIEHVNTMATGLIGLGDGRVSLNLGGAIGPKENLTIVFKDEHIIEVYEASGQKIYPLGEGKKNSLYLDAEVVEGKRVGGRFIQAYPFFMSKEEVFDRYPSGIIENANTNNSGSIKRGNGTLDIYLGDDYANQEGLLVVYKDLKIVDVYTKDGKQVIKDGKKVKSAIVVITNPKNQEGDRNSLYIDAVIEDGKFKKGKFIDAFPITNIFRKEVFEAYPSGVLVNVNTTEQGVIQLGGSTLYTSLGTRHEGLLVVYKDKKIVDIFDKDGKQIVKDGWKVKENSIVINSAYKEGDRNSLYIEAAIERGKLSKGKFIGAFSNSKQLRSDVFNKYPSGILVNVHTMDRGIIRLGGTLHADLGVRYANQTGFLIVYQDKEITHIYDQSGAEISLNKADLVIEDAIPKPVKKGIPPVLKFVAKEGDRNSFYLHAAINAEGQREGGEFVGAYPTRMDPGILDQYKEGLVDNVRVNGNGLLIIAGGVLSAYVGSDYKKQEGLRAVYKDKVIQDIYTKEGVLIYKNGQRLQIKEPAAVTKKQGEEGDGNSLYIDTVIENGIMTQGTFINAYTKQMSEKVFVKYPKGVIKHVKVRKSTGEVSFGGGFLSANLGEKYAGYLHELMVVYEAGIILQVYDEEGKLIYKDTQKLAEKGDRNTLYRDAVIENGKIKEGTGTIISSYRKEVPREILDQHPSGVFENTRVDATGNIRLAAGTLVVKVGSSKAKQDGFLVVYKDKEITHVYDTEGSLVYKDGEIVKKAPPEIPNNPEGSLNSLYINAVMEEGKLARGQFIGAFGKFFRSRVLDQYPTGVVVNVETRETGAFSIGWKTIVMHLGTQHANKKGLTVVYKDKKVQEVYDADGSLIYKEGFVMGQEGGVNSLYVNATIQHGEVVGGEFKGSYPKIRKKLIDQFPDGVFVNVYINSSGVVNVSGILETSVSGIYAQTEGNTVVYKNKIITQIFNNQGQLIYQFDPQTNTTQLFKEGQGKEGDQNSIYVNADIKDGIRIGGEFKGSYLMLPKKVFDQFPEGIVCNVYINTVADISLAGMKVQTNKIYASTEGNTVVYRNKTITHVYTKEGKLIYRADPVNNEKWVPEERSGKEGDRNSFYVEAVLRNGKMIDGKFVDAFLQSVPPEIFDKYPEGVIKHVLVGQNGTIRMANGLLDLRLGEDYVGQENMMVVYKDKKITHIFDENGNLVYRSGKRISVSQTQTPDQIKKIIDNGDLNRLLVTLGLEGTLRVLSRVHGFTITDIKKSIKEQVESLPKEELEEITGPREKFSFVRMRHINSLQGALGAEYEEVLTQELIKSVYRNIISDHRFLEALLKESKNKRNSPVLCRSYQYVYDYYMTIINMPLNGLKEDKMILTLYQKEGIKFLMDKKKAILADDQGTGKTIQTLMAVSNINEGKGAKKVLIICPRSAKEKVWLNEIKTKLKGDQKVVLLNKHTLDTAEGRRELEEARFVVVHYDAIIDLKGEENPLRIKLQEIKFDAIIVDEAHRIRNESLRTEAVKGFDAPYKFLVTGTPIVGRDVKKIYHLLNWLYPENEYFQTLDNFNARYSGSADKVRQLKEDLAGFLIRRLKKDVLDLPQLHQILIPVKLNPRHREVYERIKQDFQDWILKYSRHGKPNSISFLSRFMRCRQAAIDPLLVENNMIFDDGRMRSIVQIKEKEELEVNLGGVIYSIIKDPVTNDPLELVNKISKIRYKVTKDKEERIVIINSKKIKISLTSDISSSKYEAMDRLVREIKKKHPKDKILIFSTFKDVIEKTAKRYREYGSTVLTGGLSDKEVTNRIEEFEDEDGQTIFSATIQTGGESISLTAANHVIFINDPLTFQEKRQGIDRIYRWLQTKEVYAYTLVAKNTYDEHVSGILAEGKLLSELAFDDDPGIKNLTDDLIDQILRGLNYPKEIIDQILAFRALIKPRERSPMAVPLVFEIKEKNLRITFNKGDLKASLSLKNNSLQEFNNFDSLFEKAEELSEESRELLRNFFRGQLLYDIDNDIPIKESMFWQFVETMVPQMKHIDYHGDIERNIQIAMPVLDLLINDQNITVDELSKHVDNSLALSKSLDFLDRYNILKIMSLMGILPKQYYFNGQLLFYSPPITMFYKDKELMYRDEEIVENIAPNRKVINEETQQKNMGFEALAQEFRPLLRDEEIRLAIEAHKGNEKAAEALLEHNMMLIIKISRSVVSKISTSRLSMKFQQEDYEDVYQHVMMELSRIIGEYGLEARETPFDQFFVAFIAKTASQYVHEKANLDRKEMLILNKPTSTESEGAFEDSIEARVDVVPGVIFKETEDYLRMVEVLKKSNFQDWEIDIFTQFVEMGSIAGIVDKRGQSETSIADIVSEARDVLQRSGKFNRKESDDSESDEAMTSASSVKKNGGIALSNIKIQREGQVNRIDFSSKNIQKFKNRLNGLGVNILDIGNIKDLSAFLEVKTVSVKSKTI
ncbi:MAG: DEAD/DEAH box helicase family protein [Candidatus Omnitrophica bacterium]|nr:DEAD/DEAH box helicase family protein [Candidatus Omnitrophota bacterium]